MYTCQIVSVQIIADNHPRYSSDWNGQEIRVANVLDIPGALRELLKLSIVVESNCIAMKNVRVCSLRSPSGVVAVVTMIAK